jgi:hypothetical protein
MFRDQITTGGVTTKKFTLLNVSRAKITEQEKAKLGMIKLIKLIYSK